MAKKKIQAAEIIIKTTDGGSFKVTGKEAEKLAKNLNKTGRAAQNTDRAIKGVTQQSSNSTKEFAKMATMQGGLVQVYATIAAQVFALTAAFQFLKSSMETRNLMAAQEAFGAVTGTAYRTLTTNIQDATQGMLDFKTAAQGAAIGIASGLSASQMEQLGKAATDASLALGRDLTDSFNRLVRGVKKAEPELLDELGIVLRLENATTKYAVSIGKTREQLNAFERTQAVLNDVVGQAEVKFGAIQKIMDPDAFALGQFQKEMDDLLMGFQKFIIEGLIPIINFFKENSMALIAAVGLFVTPIIKSLLPDMNKAAADSLSKFKDHKKQAIADASEFKASIQGVGDAFAGGPVDAASSKKGLQDLGVKKFSGKNEETLSKRQVAAYRRMMREKKGIYMKMNAQERRAFRNHLNAQDAMLQGSSTKQRSIVQATENMKRAAYKGTQMVYQATMTAMTRATAFAAKAMNRAMMAAGIIGIVFMIIQAVASLINFFRDLDETAKKLREETKKSTEEFQQLNSELSKMAEVREAPGLLGISQMVEQSGNALSSADLNKRIQQYNKEIAKGTDKNSDFMKEARKMGDSLEIVAPGLAKLNSRIQEGLPITAAMVSEFTSLANGYQNAAAASKRFSQNQETLNKTLDKQIRKFKQLPFQDLKTAFSASISDLEAELGLGVDEKGNQTIDRFGLKGQLAEQRKIRGAQIAKLRLDSSKQVYSSSSGAQFSNTVLSMENQAGELLSEVEMINAIIASGHKEGSRIYERMMGQYHEEKKIREDIAAIQKQTEDDEKVIAFKEETLRQQKALESDVNALQQFGLKNVQDTLNNRKEQQRILVEEVGLERTKQGIANDRLMLTDKENKAKSDIMAAELAEKAVLEKQRGILIALEDEQGKLLFKKQDVLNMDKEALKDALVKNNLSTTEVEASAAAVENANTEADIIKFQNDLLREKLDIKEKLFELEPKMEVLKQQEKVLKDEMALARLQEKRDAAVGGGQFAGMSQFGAGGIVATQRRNQIGRHKSTISNLELQKENIGSQITNLKADTTASNFNAATGMFTGDLTETQKKFNQLKQTELSLTQQINMETVKKVMLEDIESGDVARQKLKIMQEELEIAREHIGSINPASAAYHQFVSEQKKLGVEFTEKELEGLQKQFETMELLKIETELMNGIKDTLSNGFQNMFQAMIDGTKSFKDSMKDLTKQVLMDLASMFMRAAALKAMMAFFPGMGSGGGFTDLMGLGSGDRYGGERSYAHGGVADGPESGYMAKLHGREAVVPLGNDRSIPVKMMGEGGTNIVNVTVNMQGGGAQTNTVGDGALAGMGRQIGNLVQQKLQEEMRPGGILNSSGGRGRG